MMKNKVHYEKAHLWNTIKLIAASKPSMDIPQPKYDTTDKARASFMGA